MVGVGRDLCGSFSTTHLPKQGHLQQAAQDLVQVGLEYLRRRRLHNLSGQPVPVLHHPQREEVLPHVQMDLPMLQFVPVAPYPTAGHHWEEFGPILLTPTLQIFISIYQVPSQPSLLQVKQTHLPQPFLIGEMLQCPHHPHSPLLDSHQPGHHPTAPEWGSRAGLGVVTGFNQEPRSTDKFLVLRQVWGQAGKLVHRFRSGSGPVMAARVRTQLSDFGQVHSDHTGARSVWGSVQISRTHGQAG